MDGSGPAPLLILATEHARVSSARVSALEASTGAAADLHARFLTHPPHTVCVSGPLAHLEHSFHDEFQFQEHGFTGRIARRTPQEPPAAHRAPPAPT